MLWPFLSTIDIKAFYPLIIEMQIILDGGYALGFLHKLMPNYYVKRVHCCEILLFFYVVSKALFQLRFVNFLCGVERVVFYEVVSMFLALKVVFLQNISIFFSQQSHCLLWAMWVIFVTLNESWNYPDFMATFFFGYHLCIFSSFTFGFFSLFSFIVVIIFLLFIIL
jgi:hypothetical protein